MFLQRKTNKNIERMIPMNCTCVYTFGSNENGVFAIVPFHHAPRQVDWMKRDERK